jgi:hypothetical protein
VAPSCAEYNTIKIKMWGTLKTPIVKKRRPHKNNIPPGGLEIKKTRGVFSIMRTKLVLANFDGGGGMLWRQD